VNDPVSFSLCLEHLDQAQICRSEFDLQHAEPHNQTPRPAPDWLLMPRGAHTAARWWLSNGWSFRFHARLGAGATGSGPMAVSWQQTCTGRRAAPCRHMSYTSFEHLHQASCGCHQLPSTCGCTDGPATDAADAQCMQLCPWLLLSCPVGLVRRSISWCGRLRCLTGATFTWRRPMKL
jgi:hypothetical protein